MVNDPILIGSVGVSFLFTIVVVSSEFLLGLGLALLFAREIKGARIMTLLMIAPIMLSEAVMASMWRNMFNPVFGVLNYFLSLLRIPGLNWLGLPDLALASVMVVDIWQWAPFVMLVLMAGLTAQPVDVYESAAVDGAGRLRVFRDITLPLLKPSILVVLLIRVIDALKVFDKIYVLTGGGPGHATETLSMYVFRYGFRFFQMGYAAAVSFLMIFMAVVITQRFLIRLLRKPE
jgi:multiple sugar transport system permease protein